MHTPLSSPLRWVAATMLLVTAAVHVPLVPAHLEEATYVGALFVALSVTCVALGILLVLADTPAAWAATGVTMLLALIAFLLSRTVGLPQIRDDIGNWTEPLGFPSVAAEALATVAAAYVLKHRTVHRQRKGTS